MKSPMIRYSGLLVAAMWAIAVISGCSSSPSGSKTTSLTGLVTLENQSTHSGVTVGLYQQASLDSLTEALVKQYLNSQFFFSQSALFDHRKSSAIVQTTTAADGSFKLENIPEGEYNVVAHKEGFGWQYVLGVRLTGSQNTLPSLSLKATQEVAGTLSANATWESDRHYLVTGDVTVPDGVTLTIQTNAVVEFDGFYKLVVQGDLNLQSSANNLVWFTSAELLPKQGDWSGLVIDNQKKSKQTLQYCRIDYANSAIDGNNADVLVDHVAFMENSLGVSIFDSDIDFQNCIISNGSRGLLLQVLSNIKIKKSLFFNLDDNVVTNANPGSEVVDNIFVGNKICIINQSPSALTIHHNLFDQNEMILNLEFTDQFVAFNNNTVRNSTSDAVFAVKNSYPDLSNNNFINNVMHIVTRAAQTNQGELFQSGDIQATNNWWGTTNLSEIRAKIRDGNSENVKPWLGKVFIDPILQSELFDAFPRK